MAQPYSAPRRGHSTQSPETGERIHSKSKMKFDNFSPPIQPPRPRAEPNSTTAPKPKQTHQKNQTHQNKTKPTLQTKTKEKSPVPPKIQGKKTQKKSNYSKGDSPSSIILFSVFSFQLANERERFCERFIAVRGFWGAFCCCSRVCLCDVAWDCRP